MVLEKERSVVLGNTVGRWVVGTTETTVLGFSGNSVVEAFATSLVVVVSTVQ